MRWMVHFVPLPLEIESFVPVSLHLLRLGLCVPVLFHRCHCVLIGASNLRLGSLRRLECCDASVGVDGQREVLPDVPEQRSKQENFQAWVYVCGACNRLPSFLIEQGLWRLQCTQKLLG